MTENTNMNYNNFSDFEKAYKLCEQHYSHEQLVSMLETGSVAEKQYAAMIFDSINNIDDAHALLNNLTGCDGKIREAVALRIYQFLSSEEKTRKIFAEISVKPFADATIDINGNICRLITNSSALLKKYDEFSIPYTNNIIIFARESLNKLDEFIFRDKKYVINKQIFKLYWCLETLKNFYDCADKEIIEELLVKSINLKEYTIREKVAEIVKDSKIFNQLIPILKSDDNYYVKKIFC